MTTFRQGYKYLVFVTTKSQEVEDSFSDLICTANKNIPIRLVGTFDESLDDTAMKINGVLEFEQPSFWSFV